MGECIPCKADAAPPPSGGCPCAIPVVPPCMGQTPVNPCQPGGDPGQGCSVCIPVIQPACCPPPMPGPRKMCKYVQPPRPKSYAPLRKYEPPQAKMADDTIYRKSYLPSDPEHIAPVRPTDNLTVGEGCMSSDTINKMSFKPFDNILPPCPIRPCNHKLLGDGPMQDITTNKHDYVPKCVPKTQGIVPPGNLTSSDCPLSDKTTNRLSYMPVDVAAARVNPIIPIAAIGRPTGKVESNTIHKMSYQPWEPQAPVDKPWAMKNKYCPPQLRMADETVNKLSYAPPGMYVECADDDPACIPCPEPPCQPCCYPRAAC